MSLGMSRAALLLMSFLASETAAQCPSDMNVAPSVPGLSGVEVNGAQCVCPTTSYYWRTGFIFCFGASCILAAVRLAATTLTRTPRARSSPLVACQYEKR